MNQIDKIVYINQNYDINDMHYDKFIDLMGGALNKRAMECLIKVGACNCLGYNRRTLINNYDYMVENRISTQHANQLMLFDVADMSKVVISSFARIR